MNMWRRTLYIIGLLLAIVTLTPQVSAAASMDDWRNDYNKSIAIATLLECQKFFVQEVDDDINADAYGIANTFISTPVCIRYDALTARQALFNLSGESLNREVMMSLGYTWNNDKTKLIRPDLLTLRKKILGKFNGGKEVDLSSPSMQWAAADSYITRNCTLEKKDIINSQTRVNLAKEIKMAQDGTLIDEHGTWNSYYIIINELDGDKLQQVLYKIYQTTDGNLLAGESVTEESCKAQAEKQSLNLKILFERGKKATTEARSNAGGWYVAEELCRPLKTVGPGEYDTCMSDTAKKASQCFDSGGENILKIQKCLYIKFPRSTASITEDLIKRALEHAKNSTQDQTITGGAAENEEDQPTCAITGIGWLICPTMNFIATLNDAMFDLVSRLLATHPGMFIMEDSNQTYKAWGVFRNIANVAFVIVFLVVIFSQVTSQGISNYGIKRILPRLIIGAILINASFLISALAADVSSILGSSIKGFLEQAAAGSQPVDNWNWGHMVGLVLGGGAVSAAAGVASIAALWAIGIPGAIAFLVTMLMTLLILIGRQAGIILLATLSPLAFAALILPNTEKWFKRWMSMFGGLLMVFPIVSLLFGAGSFATTILNNNNDYVMQITALIVSALPLVATPMLLRKSMDSLGAIGQMAGSLSGKFSGKAKEAASNSNFVKHREKIAAQRKAQIQSGTYKENFGKFDPRRLRNLRSRVNAARNQSGIFNKITGNYGERMSVLGASVAAAQDKETMEAANASVSAMNLDSAGLMQLIRTGKDGSGKKISEHQRRAAVQQLTPMMTGNEARGLASLSTRLDTDMRKEIASAVRTASTKAPWLGGKSLSDIQAGTYNEDAAMDSYIQEKLSAEDFNTMDAASIDALNQRAIVQARMGNGALLFNLRGTKVVHSQSNELTSKISASNRSALRRIS